MSIVANVDASTRGGKYGVYEILSPPRNDIVGIGSMEQKIFANKAIDETVIMRLIEAGNIDFETDSDDLVINGKVSRKAALHMQFEGADKPLGVRIMNAIAKSKNKLQEKNDMAVTLNAEDIEAIAKKTLELQAAEKKSAEEAENAKMKNAVSEEQVAEIREKIKDIGINIGDKDTLVDLFTKVGSRLEADADVIAENAVAYWAKGKTYKNAEGKDIRSPLYDLGMATVKLGGIKRGDENWVRNALKELDHQESTKNLREQLINPFSELNGGGYGSGRTIRVEG
ncbi:hypothetical protein FACS1894151_08110 [Spirochaetia bacterium]|nr:hypothetical protein FACS1894151_08110 [Spirochaetia bacterium]